MTLYYYSLFTTFAIICYLIARDKNIVDYLILILRRIQSLLIKAIMYLRLHPAIRVNVITKIWMSYKYSQSIKKLRNDLNIIDE
jgi:hypothetical protein